MPVANRHRRSRLTAALAVGLAVALLAACGTGSSSSAGGAGASSTSGQVHFAKTKFVLHAGLAFGAFHRYIYKPARAGDFSHPFSHKLKLIKAALAAAFIYHELGLALHDAQASPTLSKLVAPITALEARVHGLGGELRHGPPSGSALSSADGSISAIKSQAAGAGQPITEQAPSGL
jgi:hypothetical protein